MTNSNPRLLDAAALAAIAKRLETDTYRERATQYMAQEFGHAPKQCKDIDLISDMNGEHGLLRRDTAVLLAHAEAQAAEIARLRKVAEAADDLALGFHDASVRCQEREYLFIDGGDQHKAEKSALEAHVWAACERQLRAVLKTAGGGAGEGAG